MRLQFPLGVHAATCVRVGNALGAGDTARAIVTCKVTLVLSGMQHRGPLFKKMYLSQHIWYLWVWGCVFAAGVLAVLQGFVLASSKSVLGYIFTSDEWVSVQHNSVSSVSFCWSSPSIHSQIVALVSDTMTVYTFLQFLDALLVHSCSCHVLHGRWSVHRTACFLLLHHCLCFVSNSWAYSVRMLRNTCRHWDAENCCLVQFGVLLYDRPAYRDRTDVCGSAQNFR